MAVTAYATGTLTGQSIGTESIVTNVAGPGAFTFELDLNASAAGDIYVVQLYKMMVTSGTARVAIIGGPWCDVQYDPIKLSEAMWTSLTDAQAFRFGINQIKGTAHDVPWKVWAG